MGVLDTYDNSNFGRTGGSIGGLTSQYGSISEVVAAYCEDKITGREAKNELMTFFNQNDNEAEDIIYVENPCNKEIPGLDDDDEPEEEIPDTSIDNTDTDTDTDTESEGLTDDQRFMLIGLVVLGGILGFIKK
tara:strand:+ start:368 stop:766 length:399 start_codon:yes stop_codon:yes gene_type:complete